MLGFQIPVYNSKLQALRTGREADREVPLRDLEDFEGAGVPNPSLQFQVTGFSHQPERERGVRQRATRYCERYSWSFTVAVRLQVQVPVYNR